MAKHLLSLANREDKIWVNIFLNKYHHWSPWTPGLHSNTSNLFKTICKISNVLKPNLCIPLCNPAHTNFWDDPWLLDLPLHYKPTFLNMDLLDNLSFNLIAPEGILDLAMCLDAFGNNFDKNNTNHTAFDFSANNNWTWWPCTPKSSLVAAVYDHLNFSNDDTTAWIGWSHIWKLKVTPRVKIFFVESGSWQASYWRLSLQVEYRSCYQLPLLWSPF